MMKPAFGGKAIFHQSPVDGVAQPSVEATISHVWSDTCVNLEFTDAEGVPRKPTSVLVLQPGMEQPSGYYCVLVEAAVAPSLDGPVSMATMLQGETPPAVIPAPPPVDNAFVAEGAEQFVTVYPILYLAHARTLPEVEFHDDAIEFTSDDTNHILRFKAADGRTMKVVHVAGGLAAMPVAD